MIHSDTEIGTRNGLLQATSLTEFWYFLCSCELEGSKDQACVKGWESGRIWHGRAREFLN